MKVRRPQNLLRQKRLAQLLSEDGGKTPIGKLMLKAGYSKAYSKNPNKLKNTLTWQDLMEKYLPDNLLMRKHKKLLNKKEYIAIGKKGERKVVMTGEIDPDAVAKGLDMAYKIKNKYPAQKHKVEGDVSGTLIIKRVSYDGDNGDNTTS